MEGPFPDHFLEQPLSLDLSASGRMVVLDRGGKRLCIGVPGGLATVVDIRRRAARCRLHGESPILLSEDDMLIAKWNKLVIARLRIEMIEGEYAFVEEEDVIIGFGTPVTDVTVAPNGDIYVADWGGGRIYRISP